MRNYNVDTRFVQIKEETPTGRAIIQVANDSTHDNSIILLPGCNKLHSLESVNKTFDSPEVKFQKGDFLILQNEINCLKHIIEWGNKLEMNIVFNPSPFSIDCLEIIPFCKFLIVNESEAQEIAQLLPKTSEKDEIHLAEFLYKYYNSLETVILTQGKKGVTLFCSNGLLFLDSIEVDVVDTTGAGDTWIGFFIASLSMNKNVEEAMKTANIAAGICCSKKGAMDSIPSLTTVKSFIHK